MIQLELSASPSASDQIEGLSGKMG